MKRSKKGISFVGIIVILLLIAAIALLIFFLLKGGIGFGKGNGKGDSKSISSVSEAVKDEDTTEITTEKIEYISVTVSGNDYIYQNKNISLDELVKDIDKFGGDLPVKITDDNASKNSYSELVDAFKEHSIKYIESD